MPQETRTYCLVCVREEALGLAADPVEQLDDPPPAEIAIFLPPGKGEGATGRKLEDFLCQRHLSSIAKALRVKLDDPEDFEPFEVDDDEEDAD